MTEPLEILKSYFGYDSFRDGQEEIISNVCNGQDGLVVMPTGGGKSLCFQIPAKVRKGTGIIISPLIALMKDQVDGLRLSGFEAEFLNSTLELDQQRQILGKLRAGKLDILYIAPEKLFSSDYLISLFKSIPISLFAIDEAHCISQWGHDFRPEYQKLSILKKEFPDTPLMALTATADDITQKDIQDSLGISSGFKHLSSFNRPNITYHSYQRDNGKNQLLDYLRKKRGEAGIVYTLSRKSVEMYASFLNRKGFKALPYHAGLDQSVRIKNQDAFLNDDVEIIVATIAFGMGIDKSNIRFVIHMDMPKNVEGYYQETGRAGRDGLQSEAIMFYSRGDLFKMLSFTEVEENPEQSEIMKKKLYQMADYAESPTCRRQWLMNYFGESHDGNCNSCDICMGDVESIDGTTAAQKVCSAIARTNQQYGQSHIIDFLKGSRSQKIPDWQRELKTFGVGSEYTKKEWNHYIRQMIQQGIVNQDTSHFNILKLNELSMEVLRGNKKVSLYALRKPEKTTSTPEEISENGLFDYLRDIRRKLASQNNIPPYVVASDATLKEIVRMNPKSEKELLFVKGIGEAKVQKFGKAILKGLRDFEKLVK